MPLALYAAINAKPVFYLAAIFSIPRVNGSFLDVKSFDFRVL